MATLSIDISSADLAKLKELPVEIDKLVRQANAILENALHGKDPGNALSGLLGNLNDLAGQAQQAPELNTLIQPIQDIISKLPADALGDFEAIEKAVEELLSFFGPLKDVLLSGRPEQAFQESATKAFEHITQLLKPNDEIQSAFSGLEEFIELFGSLITWGQSPPHPEEVVKLLSRAIIGIPHDLLEDAANKLESALSPLTSVLPDGPELEQWRGAATAKLAFWQRLRLDVADKPIDWLRLEVDLRAEAHQLAEICAGRDRLYAMTLGNLNRIDFNELSDVHTAIRAIPVVKPPQISSFTDQIKEELHGMLDFLQTWNPTAEELRVIVRTFLDSITDYLGASPLGQLRAILIDFQHRLLIAIESLPFKGLAHELSGKLAEIATAMDVLDPNILRKPVHEFFQKIEDKLHEFSPDTVKQAIEHIWQGVENSLKQVQQLLESVRSTIEGVITSLQQMVEQAKPALEQVSQTVLEIKTGLDSFDLSQPTSLIINELHKLKDVVAALDLSVLPGPAIDLLKTGAEGLRQINLSETVNPPLNDELAKIDPTPIIQHAADSLNVVTGKLKLLDPASITQNLDKPIDDLMAAIANFGPEGMEKLLHEALKPIEEALDELDIEHLFAPLMHQFAELNAKVDAFLSPDVIFQPIEKLFQPFVDLIDKAEPTHLARLFEPHADTASGHATGAITPPSALAKSDGLLKNSLQPVVDSEDALFGFRPGDMLIPIIDLHRQIETAVNNLDDSILDPAAQLLNSALPGRLQMLNPANLELLVSSSFASFHAEFDVGSIGARLLEAEGAYHEASVIIANAALQPLTPEDSAAASRVLELLSQVDPLTLVPDLSQSNGILSATASIQANLDLSSLRSAYSVLRDIESLITPIFGDSSMTANSLRQAIHAIDPAPVRVEINAIFDQLGQKISGLQEAVIAAVDEFLRGAQEFLMPVSPGAIIQLASQLHSALKDQLLALSPSTLKEDVRPIFDAVKIPLRDFSPAILIDELNGLRDDLIKTLGNLTKDFLPDPAPYNALIAELEQFKPSVILAPITESLQPMSELVATLDVTTLLQPLLDAIARIRDEIPQIVAEIEAALDDVLAAFPEGDSNNVSVSLSVSTG